MLCTRRALQPLTLGLPPGFCWDYDPLEIFADGLVHACGLAFAVIGAFMLAVEHATLGPNPHRIASLVYAVGLISTFGVSAAYNLWPLSPIKWVLRRFDHATIYLFIAATCTPFLSYVATGSAPVVPLGVIWASALAGAALKLLLPGKLERASIVSYLVLGWVGLLAIWCLSDIPKQALALTVAGAAVYAFGVVFHQWQRLRFQNAAWHAFVLLAASCQYAAILICLSGP